MEKWNGQGWLWRWKKFHRKMLRKWNGIVPTYIETPEKILGKMFSVKVFTVDPYFGVTFLTGQENYWPHNQFFGRWQPFLEFKRHLVIHILLKYVFYINKSKALNSRNIKSDDEIYFLGGQKRDGLHICKLSKKRIMAEDELIVMPSWYKLKFKQFIKNIVYSLS